MDDTHLPKMVFFSELATGGRNISRPLKRFKDGLTATLATDRSAWKTAIDEVFKASSCSAWTRSDRPARKGDLTLTVVACPHCGCICALNFVLRFHLRSN